MIELFIILFVASALLNLVAIYYMLKAEPQSKKRKTEPIEILLDGKKYYWRVGDSCVKCGKPTLLKSDKGESVCAVCQVGARDKSIGTIIIDKGTE